MPTKRAAHILTLKRRRLFLDALATGMSVTSSARVAGLSRRYMYELRDLHPDFATEWDDALEQAADLLEDAARQRALGAKEAIVYKGQVTGQVERRSDILLMFYLKGKRNTFRDNAKVEISTSDKLGELMDAITGKPEAAAVPEPEAPVTENGE